jgi:hypothetical protein
MVTWKEGPIVSALLLAEIQASNVNLYGIFFKIVFNCSYLYVFQKFFYLKEESKLRGTGIQKLKRLLQGGSNLKKTALVI